MSRSATALLALLLACASAAPAAAQLSVGIGGGPAMPRGELAAPEEGIEIAENGYHLMLSFQVSSVDLPWTIRGDIDYQKLGAGQIEKGYRHVAGFIAAKIDAGLEGAFSPYALLGAGMYVSDFHGDATRLAPGWNADAGLNVGAGAAFSIGGLSPFVEIRYHRVVAYSPRSFMPVTVGIFF